MPESSIPSTSITEDTPLISASLAADITEQWSWAASSARIPQISFVDITVADAVPAARLRVVLRDGEEVFGSYETEAAIELGTSRIRSIKVPLSPRAMATVDERRAAECVVELQELPASRRLARLTRAVDLQPRDLFYWTGDPRREGETDDGELSTYLLGQSLLASFVRPNHPEVALLAREAADIRGHHTGEPSFAAFQEDDPATVEAMVEDSITAIYEAIQARHIAYSEPPPGWDYKGRAQRVRDHSSVARGGLGTCMDTTVLLAAVVEHVGLQPVLLGTPGHIFVGYWRQKPSTVAAWYPDSPVVLDQSKIDQLARGGWLGAIETTALTEGSSVTASAARDMAMTTLFNALRDGGVTLIDVPAARRAGISPLPAVNDRADGVTEIIEYRPGAPAQRTEIRPPAGSRPSGPRFVDNHPPRYRTWKSSLFGLNGMNALLNLGNGPSVQPLVLPPEAMGVVEDRLNQDYEFNLLSGYQIPEIYHARDIPNAVLMDPADQISHLEDRKLFVQRISRTRSAAGPVPPAKFVSEIRSMARRAKEAHDERGMNPLFMCIGMLRSHKAGDFLDAPLILVPVHIVVRRGRAEFSLRLDTSSGTTPNAALLEWLRREHELSIPELAEPAADHAGIDVDGVLSAVRRAVSSCGLELTVKSEAKLALLDLSSFRMWQDLHKNGDAFLNRPLVKHLVHTPTEQFIDPAASSTDAEGEIEKLETPIPADATQKTAVQWAREGRTFVLQGPPGTGKSQTITNMVAECLVTGMRVLFVAEKGTALSVVQRRLNDIGLAPFMLNLHHEGSNPAEVRAQLKRSLNARIAPDPVALENAQRRLRNSRFELAQYPARLHRANAAGLSAYSAHDRLLVLGDGPAISIPVELVAGHTERVEQLRELFASVQPIVSAAAPRSDHAWRLVGRPPAGGLPLTEISTAIRGVLAGVEWVDALAGPLREALDQVRHPAQLQVMLLDQSLPQGPALAAVLESTWPARAGVALSNCERTIAQWRDRLHGYPPEVLHLDLRPIQADLTAANESGVIGRGKRQSAALKPLTQFRSAGAEQPVDGALDLLRDLIAVQHAGEWVVQTLSATPGLAPLHRLNVFSPGALDPFRRRFDELLQATGSLRDSAPWSARVRDLAAAGALAEHAHNLTAYANAWSTFWKAAGVTEADFEVWRGARHLNEAVRAHADSWRRQIEHERMLPLQRWTELVRHLEPLIGVGMSDTRTDLLEGRLSADTAEDAFARGVAQASERERLAAEGLDHFDSAAHDQRVRTYAASEAEVRKQWITAGPALLLERRGSDPVLSSTGGLARELEKTRLRLGTRAIMRRFGDVIQRLTPLVLSSPSSAVDLIEPGTIDFDIVIFDEASQITVAEAVGAIGRAKAVVVVGDSKQMPPSRKIGAQTAADVDFDDDITEEIVEDQESILSECELARVPTLSLSWHYRSQDEALIAFSNDAYYNGGLSSFPTPTLLSTETGLELRRIDGRFIRSSSAETKQLASGVIAGKATNPEEAEAIVAAVRELLSGPRKPTIGIVTFNEKQRELIEELLVHADDAAINAAMDEAAMGPADVLFVKALEQVQGDERDIALFSIAFSKQANGKIPLNFGPLSNLGGERRLNVAVTRARRKNIVFCSFDPEELAAETASYRGVKDLKQFLLFARTTGRGGEISTAPGRAPVRDRHRDDIAAALNQVGLHVMTDVGLSDFRLDLVLGRRDKPDGLLLPVLLDGEAWRARRTVSDRDVLPIEVLRGLMGWPAVSRIWWPMWLQNREEVVHRILTEVGKAEAALAAPPAITPSTPPAVIPAVPPASVVASPAGRSQVDVPAQARAVAAAPTNLPSAPQTTPSNRFVPADTNPVGSKDVLDALPDRAAAAAVREQILDVIDAEGPVELNRLVRLVARRFGLTTVREQRSEEIARIVPARQLRKGKAGSFAWPTSLEPAAWTGYRTANPDAPRALDEVALEEIANAMAAVTTRDPDAGPDDVLRRTAEIFGITRLGANVRARLELARKLLSTRPAPQAAVTSPTPASAPSLSKGANLGLASAGQEVLVGLGWDSGGVHIEIDGSALALAANGKVVDDAHFVFFNNVRSPDGAIVHHGASKVAADREQISIDLLALSPAIAKIVFVASIHECEARGHSFALVPKAHIRLMTPQDQSEVVRFDLPASENRNETAMILGELYRRGEDWKFRAVGQGYASGLRGVAKDFGVDVE